ncbi:hypothetical protein ACFPES_04170 [Paenibacillus sp. GCM10023248]|uniref:hypothetical protein n=1 Tax=unclassified Paenibacillus TaxID=185978 RepID=UPI00237856C9|nr:hypothetical protein [Paenibacillus sp. MAHUQ-63]MDD9266220.1 hypothetical protein [Paenibacillus sp. MAHUQ-63]
MRIKWLLLLICIGVLGVGGYAGYTYSVNVIADKLAAQLLAETEANQQLLEQVELPAMPQSSGDVSLQGNTDAPAPNALDKLSSQSSSASPKEDSSKKQASTAEEGTNSESEGNEQPALSFSSKQEAVKFAMSRFSASELNKFRQMAGGGLTSEEKAELKKIAFSKFTAAEIAAVQKAVTTK